ncbi:DUF3592 domain-containing protein [Ruminococcus albus]|uniref:DUF3592 domain-containing protein n=1 Tax=Ruminococcus albus SY3 TaxID=1341156 RepID=A0A011VTY0_RUMAL|nr:DUF3592 domain-containing protein [Ruminococcus albus]EXM38721.1 hypothetical protein RASY3_18900 [Ruminococcus albus SY3]EXM40235.1 hypothetical protein RASY3_08515 [Ruminococcus albus SY3]
MKKFQFTFRIIFCVLFIIGGIVTATMFSSLQHKIEHRCTEYVYGKVMTVELNKNKKSRSFHTTVQFELDGKTIIDESNSSTQLTEGESVKVMYDPDDHNVYYIPELYTSSKTLIICGFGLIGIGIIVLIKALKNRT